jgi:hypothetical protein
LPPAKFPAAAQSKTALVIAARDHSPVQPRFLLGSNDVVQRATPAGTVIAVADRKSELFALRVRLERGYHDLDEMCVAINANISGARVNRYALEHAITGGDNCNTSHVDIILMGLDEDLPRVGEMLERYLADPLPADWDRAKAHQVRWIDGYRHDVDELVTSVSGVAHERWGSSSLELTSVSALHDATLATATRAMAGLRSAPRTIVYVGRRSLDEVAAILPRAPRASAPKRPSPADWRGNHVVATDVRDIAKDVSARVMFDLDVGERDRPLVDLFEQAWDDHRFSTQIDNLGRVSLDVGYPEPHTRGHTWVSIRIHTTPAQTATAIGHAIDDVLSTSFSATDVERARSRIDEGLRSDWLTVDVLGWRRHDQSARRDVTLALLDWHDRGLAPDPRVAYAERLAQLTGADLDQLRARLRAATRRIAIVGSLEGVDRTKLRALGPLTEIPADKLFTPPRSR